MLLTSCFWILRAYPRTWRMRYEEEVRALLEQNSPSLGDVLGLALGLE